MKLFYKHTVSIQLYKLIAEAQCNGLEIKEIELTQCELEKLEREMGDSMTYRLNVGMPMESIITGPTFNGYPITVEKESELDEAIRTRSHLRHPPFKVFPTTFDPSAFYCK